MTDRIQVTANKFVNKFVQLLVSLLAFFSLSLIDIIPQAIAGEYSQVIGVGMHFYTGAATGSLTGSNGYSLNFGAEKSKGFIRPSIGTVIQYATGTASISSTSSAFTLYEADFLAGFKIYPLQTGYIEPFVGANGVIGAATLKLPAAVGETAANTLGISYGFVLNMGVNISKSNGGNALSIQGQYWYLASTVGGTNFDLGGFRFTLGLVF